MIRKPARGLFVTGTSTDVGKTFVAAGIAKVLRDAGRRVGVYKPVASGCAQQAESRVAEDARQLWFAAGRPLDLQAVCPQAFLAPLAPHLAATAEGKTIDVDLLTHGISQWASFDIVLIEGAGGLMSPVTEQLYVADLAAAFGYPLVIVAANMIGVVNQTLQTLIAADAFDDGLPVAGVVLNDVDRRTNDPSRMTNFAQLSSHCSVPLLAHVGWQDARGLADVDWFGLAGGIEG